MKKMYSLEQIFEYMWLIERESYRRTESKPIDDLKKEIE